MTSGYGLGSGDVLEVAHMDLYVAQMTGQKSIRVRVDAVTVNSAKVMHFQVLRHRGRVDASFVQLQARDAGRGTGSHLQVQ